MANNENKNRECGVGRSIGPIVFNALTTDGRLLFGPGRLFSAGRLLIATSLCAAALIPTATAVAARSPFACLPRSFPMEDQEQTLAKAATWQTPDLNAVIDRFGVWLDAQPEQTGRYDELGDFLRVALESLRPADTGQEIDQDANDDTNQDASQRVATERLDIIIDGIALVRSDVREFRDRLRQPFLSTSPNQVDFHFDNVTEHDFIASHLGLFYGRWLAQHHFYDEALERLEKIELDKVLDPAALLFYRGLMQHQLLEKDACVATAKQLLENRDSIPRRYAALAQLMIADIEPLKPDSLDEVARLMNDVSRRTGLNRSGKRVRDQEKEVIDKLDKLIEDMEKKQQQQQQQAQASKGGGQGPTKPINANKVGGGGATGDVKNKRQEDGGQWGDLPPSERAAALAEMSKDMPPHYRAVIEEYFRRLADEEQK